MMPFIWSHPGPYVCVGFQLVQFFSMVRVIPVRFASFEKYLLMELIPHHFAPGSHVCWFLGITTMSASDQ